MPHKFGGQWTIDKLDIVGKYIDAYSQVFKHQKVRPVYIDAFAGTGSVDIKINGDELTISGSAKIALQSSHPFEIYIFVEQDPNRVAELESLCREFPDRKVMIFQKDCNDLIQDYCNRPNIKYYRILLFLDPYSTQVRWETIEAIAKTTVIDLWYLFPINAVHRLMPTKGAIQPWGEEKLKMLFGTDSWKDILYCKPKQISIFDDSELERASDLQCVLDYIYNRLDSVFQKVSRNPAILRNSKNSPLFALFFAMSNPSEKAQRLAFKIAEEILKNHE